MGTATKDIRQPKPLPAPNSDFYGVTETLNAEELATLNQVREFMNTKVAPIINKYWAEDAFPFELLPPFKELNIGGLAMKGYGCRGGSVALFGFVAMEMARIDASIATFFGVHNGLAMGSIYLGGSEEQKQRWLPPMHAGEKIGCFGLTEPDAGSDPGSMRTTAKRDGSDWILNGAKMWITNGSIADVAIVWARTDGGDINGFLVEKDMPGFEAPLMHHKLSLRASVTSELVLRDVRVPEENRFPEISTLRGPLSCLNEARFGIVFGVVGSARTCLETALDYSKERIVFDKPIAGYQLTQQKLAEMALEVNRGALVALHLGRMKDEGTLRPEQVSMGKMGNVRGALEVARSARSILGGNGITLEYPVIRHMNNLETVLTYEGTHEVHTLSVGKALTGENAFR